MCIFFTFFWTLYGKLVNSNLHWTKYILHPPLLFFFFFQNFLPRSHNTFHVENYFKLSKIYKHFMPTDQYYYTVSSATVNCLVLSRTHVHCPAQLFPFKHYHLSVLSRTVKDNCRQSNKTYYLSNPTVHCLAMFRTNVQCSARRFCVKH